jgi:hypothetical protein
LGIISKKYTAIHTNGFEPIDQEGFRIYKINGTAGFYNGTDHEDRYPWEDSISVFDAVLKTYAIAMDDGYNLVPALSFAWEDEHKYSSGLGIIELAERAAMQTDALVIIGYSFPFFNREIDKRIIGVLDPSTKIYIQDRDPNAVYRSFKAINPKLRDIELHIDQYPQFHLPVELSL